MESSTIGTILEIRAVEWFLSHGFRVWRAVDGGQTGDIVIATSAGLLEVEVRAGSRRKTRPGVYFRQRPGDTASLYFVGVQGEPGLYWRASPGGPAKNTLLQAFPIHRRIET